MNKITPHNVENVYQELISKYILKGIFSEKYSNLEKHESPDFICTKKQLGVEVTNAMIGERRAQWNFMMRTYQNRDSLTERDYDNMKKFSYSLTEFPDGNILPGGSYWGDEVNLIRVYNRKMNLIENKDISSYSSLELFINATFMEEHNLTDFLLYLYKEKLSGDVPNSFDIVFIRTEGRLINIKYRNLSVQEYNLDNKFFKRCKNRALDEIEEKSNIIIERKNNV